MEIVFRRVYGLAFDSQEQHLHAHDHYAAAEEEGRGLIGQGVGEGPPPPHAPKLPGSHHHHHSDARSQEEEEAAAHSSSVHLPYYSAQYGSLGHAPPRVSSVYPNDPGAAAVRRSASCYDFHQSLLAAAAAGEEADAPVEGARHCHHHSEERHIVAAFQNQGRSVLTAVMMEIGKWHVLVIGVGWFDHFSGFWSDDRSINTYQASSSTPSLLGWAWAS